MYEPARYFVRVTKREKRACRCCQEVHVTMPPLAPRIVEKGLASDRVVMETVVAKYCDHLPLYRQAAMLEREAGLEIGRATLDGWVMRVGEMLQPVVAAMRQDLLRASYLQADETSCRCRCTISGARIIRRTCGNTASREAKRYSIFAWAEGARVRGSSWASGKGFCKPTVSAYDKIGGPKLVHVGCWAHARRKFVDAVKVNPQDGAAVKMVTRMDALFLVDRDARQQQLSGEERLALRGEHAESWAEEIRQECVKLRRDVLPKSALGKAVDVHLKYVAEAAAVFRLRGSGVVQQPGGELDAPGSAGPQELAARGQREGRTQGRGDSLGGRILPQAGCAGEGLSAGRAARHGSPQALRSGPAYAQSLVSRPHLTTLGSSHAYDAPVMQALLTEHFKLAVHFETKESAVLALVLIKPGTLGPKLVPHAEGPPCDAVPAPDVFPPRCHLMGMTMNSGRAQKPNHSVAPSKLGNCVPIFIAILISEKYRSYCSNRTYI